MTAADMVRAVHELTKTWDYEAISLGYPGPVKDNRPFREPINIAGGWTTFDFQKAFGKPVRCINDAAMQALGSYAGGRMLFLGLGTGLGTSIVEDWRVEPLEIAHLPYRKGRSYEEYLGESGLQKLGEERWEKHVHKVCDLFRAALLCDGIVLGGGNARKLVRLPDATTRGANENAITGGIRMWERVAESTPPEFIDHRTAAASVFMTGEHQLTSTTAAAAKVAQRPVARKSTAKRSGGKKAVRKKTSTNKAATKRSRKPATKAAPKTVARRPIKSGA
jgi:polyphosphate glucokinase